MINTTSLVFTVIFSILLSPPTQAQEGVGKKAVDRAFNPSDAPEKAKKQKHKIPIKVNLGFGLSQYRLFDVYDTPAGAKAKTPSVFGTEFTLAGIVENRTLRRFKDKIPEDYRKTALKLREVSATHLVIPLSFYVQPRNSSGIEAYGLTWGLVPRVGASLGPINLFLGGGPILTYMHFRDFAFDEPVHFIRPGLRGVAGATLSLFNNYFAIEVGGKGDIYIPQHFYTEESESSLWNIRGTYIQLHFRYPLEVEAKI